MRSTDKKGRKSIAYKDRTYDPVPYVDWWHHQCHVQPYQGHQPKQKPRKPDRTLVMQLEMLFLRCFSCPVPSNTAYIKVCKMNPCKDAKKKMHLFIYLFIFLAQGFSSSKMWQTVTLLKAQSLLISLPQDTELTLPLSLCLHLPMLMFKPWGRQPHYIWLSHLPPPRQYDMQTQCARTHTPTCTQTLTCACMLNCPAQNDIIFQLRTQTLHMGV